MVKVAALQKLAKRELLLFVLVLKHHQLLLQDLVLEIGLIPQYLREFRRRAEEFKSNQVARLMKAELEDEPVEVDSEGDPVSSSESVESLVQS